MRVSDTRYETRRRTRRRKGEGKEGKRARANEGRKRKRSAYRRAVEQGDANPPSSSREPKPRNRDRGTAIGGNPSGSPRHRPDVFRARVRSGTRGRFAIPPEELGDEKREHLPSSRSLTSLAARSPSARRSLSIFFDRSAASFSPVVLTAQPIPAPSPVTVSSRARRRDDDDGDDVDDNDSIRWRRSSDPVTRADPTVPCTQRILRVFVAPHSSNDCYQHRRLLTLVARTTSCGNRPHAVALAYTITRTRAPDGGLESLTRSLARARAHTHAFTHHSQRTTHARARALSVVCTTQLRDRVLAASRSRRAGRRREFRPSVSTGTKMKTKTRRLSADNDDDVRARGPRRETGVRETEIPFLFALITEYGVTCTRAAAQWHSGL